MSYKVINITVPSNAIVEDDNIFSPEENYMILKIGRECLIEGRKAVIGLTQKEMSEKIKNEYMEQIKKMETELLVDREVNKKMEEQMSKMYEIEVEKFKKTIDTLSKKVMSYECENRDLIRKEVEKERERYDIIMKEKEKQVDKIADAVQNLISSSNDTATSKGTKGEKNFNDYADTFVDFNGFKIIDKHTQNGEGDFHLHFEEFDVLADAKNYSNKVPNGQREKIKKDLLKNEHINFAWLVSLNTTIETCEKAPITYEWINTRQCILYINNLKSYDNPRQILRIAWTMCKGFFLFIDVDTESEELLKFKELFYKLIDDMKDCRKQMREINTIVNTLKSALQVLDDKMITSLQRGSNEIVKSSYPVFDEWWEKNIEVTNEDSVTLSSTELWFLFKQENKNVVKEFEITSEKFKQYIKSKVPLSCLVIKSKSVNSALDIKGIKLKSGEKTEISISTTPKIKEELEADEDVESKTQEKKKRVIKKSNEFYFDKELDEKIMTAYEDKDNDVMVVSSLSGVKIYQVVSLLMKHKIITKRDEARGYEKYKETDEYKNKITK